MYAFSNDFMKGYSFSDKEKVIEIVSDGLNLIDSYGPYRGEYCLIYPHFEIISLDICMEQEQKVLEVVHKCIRTGNFRRLGKLVEPMILGETSYQGETFCPLAIKMKNSAFYDFLKLNTLEAVELELAKRFAKIIMLDEEYEDSCIIDQMLPGYKNATLSFVKQLKKEGSLSKDAVLVNKSVDWYNEDLYDDVENHVVSDKRGGLGVMVEVYGAKKSHIDRLIETGRLAKEHEIKSKGFNHLSRYEEHHEDVKELWKLFKEQRYSSNTSSTDGSVYLVQDSHGNTKIGFSTNPERRLKSLRTSSASKLTFLGAIPGTRENEKRLHRLFADRRVGREWFNLSSADITQILSA